jgi:hypothetical protein
MENKQILIGELVDKITDLNRSLEKAETTMEYILEDYFRQRELKENQYARDIILHEHNRHGVLAEIVGDNLWEMRKTISNDIQETLKKLEAI